MATLSNGEIFHRAADYIREHGLWQQGDTGKHGGPRCVIGAVESALLGVTYPSAEEYAPVVALGVLAATRVTGCDHLGGLFDWNDAPERTAEEVIALLDGLAFDEDLKAAAYSSAPENRPEPIPSPSLLKEAVHA